MTARDRTMIIVVCILASIVGSWMFVIQPKRDEASQLGAQLTSAQTKLDSARAQVAQGEVAKGTFARDYAAVAGLGEAVPPDDNVPSLIFQLQSAATGVGVDFQSVKLTAGSVAQAPAAPTAPASTAAATTAGAAATQAVTATLPPGATVGPAGFPTEPFTFTFAGNFFHLADFLGRLERFVVASNKRVSVSGRLMTLNAIALGAAPQGFPHITASISATTYLVPAAQGLLNGASPTGPAASGAQTVSTPGTSLPATTAVATSSLR